ncbi:hypothetical protein ACFSCX_15030 [Bacillus salitolerans]|uniref:Uncharacterized protein n=1 Tax=Bacillus salitolerans TaxID=1437434 RepID=A0ABW4LUR3_9BACI
MEIGKNFYHHLPNELLADFYFEIKKNIDLGILSEAMYLEIGLIKEAALQKGLSELDLFSLSSRAKDASKTQRTFPG